MAGFRINLTEITVPQRAHDCVQQALRDGHLAQDGPWIVRFEEALQRFLGIRHVVAVCNGSMADAVAIRAASILYDRRTHVVVPALTFVAHPDAVLHAGLTPIFCDVLEDFTMDPERAGELAREHDAILFPAHLMGRIVGPFDADPGVPVIEDACEAFGSVTGGRLAGTLHDAGTFSFYASHTITTGEGGAIATDDDALAALARNIRNHGRITGSSVADKFRFPLMGFNAKMNSLSAAVGVAMMEQVGALLASRMKVFHRLNRLLGDRFPQRHGEIIVPHAYPMEYPSETARDAALTSLTDAGIECRKLFSCLPVMEHFADLSPQGGPWPVAGQIARTHLYVPCHGAMTEEDCAYLTDRVKETL